MRRVSHALLLGLGIALLQACKDPASAAAADKLEDAQDLLQKGRRFEEVGQLDQAIAAYRQAAVATPNDPTPHVLIAEAYQKSGNDGAAILALKQAEKLSPSSTFDLKRQQADLYVKMGRPLEAIRAFVELMEAAELNDAEVLSLARMQLRHGRIEDAGRTVTSLLQRKPDDPEALAIKAELFMRAGEEMAATKLMDELLTKHPNLVSARVLRARYFLNNGYPQYAEQDLALIQGAPAKETEVVELKARAFNALRRYGDTVELLTPLLEERPRDADLLGIMAETRLYLDELDEAHSLVDRTLALRPKNPRALYVRAKAYEKQNDFNQAIFNYQQAVQADPGFWPALSRLWRVHLLRSDKVEALEILERLFLMGEASVEEKAALAEMYARNNTHLTRANILIDEALRHKPKHPRYREVKTAIARARAKAAATHYGSGGGGGKNPNGVIIMKGGQ
jgi:tetratricopeptide (TPR) repeat protein